MLIANEGEAAARAAGVGAATGDVVVLLDDDVEAGPGLVSEHLKCHAHADAAALLVVGYMPVADPESVGASLYSRRYESHCMHWQEHPGTVLRTLWAGNMSLRRDDFLKVAGTPPKHRYDFHADRAFGLRCEATGLRGVFAPQCRALHHYSRGVSALARDARNQGLALIRMHDEFGDRFPPPRSDYFTWYLPNYQRPLVDLCRRPRAAATIASALKTAVHVTDSLGGPKAHELATLMMTIERQRGAITASRELRADLRRAAASRTSADPS
jgi:glycosyltransferase involved in cell wall biosynthesis